MAIYLPPSLRSFKPRHICFSSWMDHLPFGYDLIAGMRPAITVELGTQAGLSFFTFCQSISEHQIDGVAYAVDTWEGEAHTGKYDKAVFNSVSDHAREHYPGHAYLMRMLFQEALQHFDEDSIDLLHIDGLHTYDAVSEDFRSWYPKMKPGGIILLHDTYARTMNFGVWKFWREIEPEYDSFEFKHGFGLGVVQKPGGQTPRGELLRLMLDGDEVTRQEVRAFYVHAARYHQYQRRAAKAGRQARKESTRNIDPPLHAAGEGS